MNQTNQGVNRGLIEALGQVPLFANIAEEQLGWLAEQGNEIWLQPGEIHRAEGDPADHVFVMFSGEVRITQKVGQQELVLVTYGPKTLFGELPILTGTPYYWAGGRAVSECHILELPQAAFWQMLAMMPTVATSILRTMAERVQELQARAQQRGTLIELGSVAAGLAHELNQPIAAVTRDVQGLHDLFQTLPALTLKLDPASLLAAPDSAPTPDPTQSSPQAGPVQAGLELLDEIEQSSARISELVSVMKAYSFMDLAPLQEVDVHEGLENTLIVLRHKLKAGVVIRRNYDRSLPKICAYGSELNQVWTHLLDTAIDALAPHGQLDIRTWREQDQVLIEIAHDGAEIPAEIQQGLFEPGFSSKGVAQGKGLGLVTSYRTVAGKHQGDLRVASQPGHTLFQVRLPIGQLKNDQSQNG
ncbi:sensor histidine kinase [Leptolyngbya sp. FACHB-261]|uniref:sensor histidine kinase n=1 Tax=Leptolyngbya sp. FACHB-261 TaxID=2692806 RepID=UPI0016829A6E|nr:cyclic nucleotide-binding domain-containing protein [Leptolyngbya sp. FACHB-261]MBD2103018.1 cyclic nucleotide-binding domain-containing protein [Leptolyngbya sp. FACHB-261]